MLTIFCGDLFNKSSVVLGPGISRPGISREIHENCPNFPSSRDAVSGIPKNPGISRDFEQNLNPGIPGSQKSREIPNTTIIPSTYVFKQNFYPTKSKCNQEASAIHSSPFFLRLLLFVKPWNHIDCTFF